MRVIIFFDLPTGTHVERKAYMQFRKYLLHAGYDMLQYSVYGKPTITEKEIGCQEMLVL